MKYCCILLFTLSIAISQDEGYVDSTLVRNPKIAWKLGFIPGLGQLYNGKYLKAVGFVVGQYIAVNRFNEFKNEERIAMRNTYAWWIFGLSVLSILDAYVDAQLSTFPVKLLESSNDIDSLLVPVK